MKEPSRSKGSKNMRRKLILPLLILGISVLLVGAAVASQRTPKPDPRQTQPTPEQEANFFKTRDEFQKTKKKAGDDTLVIGVWRNCKFHVLRIPAERFIATASDGQVVESVEPAGGAKAADVAEKQLPARDPACDNVEPTRDQIDANRAAIEAEEAKLNPSRPVRPGG